MERLLRRAALRQVGARTRGEFAISANGMPVYPSHPAAQKWSVMGALMAEQGWRFVPSQETLQRELGKPIELLIDAVPGVRGSVDWKRYTVVDVLTILSNWFSDDALFAWWERAVVAAQEQGL